MRGTWIQKPTTDATVVFVHGILSDGESCWRNVNGTYWPTLCADEDALKALGIYVFTYKTGIFSGTYRLGDVVDALKEQMKLDGLLESRQLFFVAHSMGGIVVRKLLVERAADFVSRGIQIGLFLVASPSLGAEYANFLAPLARALKHSQADALRFSQQNAWLMDLDKEFNNLKSAGTLRLAGKELVEDCFIVFKRLFFVRQVVEPFSGAKYFGEPLKVPDSDHFSIAKPAAASSFQHRVLLQFISEMIAESDRVRGKADSIKNEIRTTFQQTSNDSGDNLADRVFAYVKISSIDFSENNIRSKVETKLHEAGPFSHRGNDLLNDAIDLVAELVRNSLQHGRATDIEIQIHPTCVKLLGGEPYPIERLLTERSRRGGATALILLREACEEAGDSLVLKDFKEVSEPQRSGYLLSTRTSYLEGKARVDLGKCSVEVSAEDVNDPILIECLEAELSRYQGICKEYSIGFITGTDATGPHKPSSDIREPTFILARHNRMNKLWQMKTGAKLRYTDSRIQKIVERYEKLLKE